nr:MAG TPA: hypothetical protein [Caudoviricetes sp.]
MIKALQILVIMPFVILLVLAAAVLGMAAVLAFISMDLSVFSGLYEAVTAIAPTEMRLLYVGTVAISAVIVLIEESYL